MRNYEVPSQKACQEDAVGNGVHNGLEIQKFGFEVTPEKIWAGERSVQLQAHLVNICCRAVPRGSAQGGKGEDEALGNSSERPRDFALGDGACDRGCFCCGILYLITQNHSPFCGGMR